jgi:heterotetrameric sarcosine oxidase gamma subunit
MGDSLGTSPAILDSSRVRIVEEPRLDTVSVRQSRMRPDRAAIAAIVARWGLELPDRANGLRGAADLGCAWIEPSAWLLTSTSARQTPASATGVLVTDASDRFAAFRVSGPASIDVVAAGCDPAIVGSASACARTRFASLCTAIIQRWAEDDYRFLVDVSIAQVFARWLRQQA